MSSSSDENSNSSSSDQTPEADNMEALLEEMGDTEGDDISFLDGSESGHEMEDSRKRALLRAPASSRSNDGNDQSSSGSSSASSLEVEDEVGASSEEESEGGEIEDCESEPEEEEEENDDDNDDEAVQEEEGEPLEELAPAPDDDEDSVIDEDEIEDTLKKIPKEKKEKIKLKKLSEDLDPNDAEAVEMAKLLGEWGVDDDDDNNNSYNDSEDNDDDDESEASEREVILDPNVIDHIVLVAPDLDEATKNFEKMTGIAPKVCGHINGLGLRCARVSFNDSSFIEIIAPDDKKPGPIGTLIKSRGIKQLTPFHFAIRTNRAEELKEEVKAFGYTPDHITMFSGNTDGDPKKWELLHLYGHKLGGICPFFVDWNNSKHPCATIPVVGKLKKFSIRAPADDPVHRLMQHVQVQGVNVEIGKTKVSFQFNSPEGTIKFASSKAIGFKFPGFANDEDGDNDNELAAAVDNENEVTFADIEAPELLDVDGQAFDEAPLPPPEY